MKNCSLQLFIPLLLSHSSFCLASVSVYMPLFRPLGLSESRHPPWLLGQSRMVATDSKATVATPKLTLCLQVQNTEICITTCLAVKWWNNSYKHYIDKMSAVICVFKEIFWHFVQHQCQCSVQPSLAHRLIFKVPANNSKAVIFISCIFCSMENKTCLTSS